MSRDKVLIKASWVSIIGNAILSLSKLFVGVFAGSLAVLGDGIDSATDVVISIIMIFTAKLISKPPNKKYVYGYEKAESIATKVLSLIIFYAGIQMIVSSIQSFFLEEPRALPGTITIYVTLLSIVGKLLLYIYQYRKGKAINSPMLVANALNMRSDVLISVGVLVGLAFTFILKLPILDSVTGLLIGLFIIKTSIGIFVDSYVDLMDGVKDPTVYDKIFEAVHSVPGALNPHRVRSRQIGSMYMIALDLEVDGELTINQAHKIAEQVEQSIKNSVGSVYDIVIHIEPSGVRHSKEMFGVCEQTLDEPEQPQEAKRVK